MLKIKPADDILLVYAHSWHDNEYINWATAVEKGEPGKYRIKTYLTSLVKSPPEHTRLMGIWEEITPVGYICFSSISPEHRQAELHITMSPDIRKMGEEAMGLGLNHAFDSGLFRLTFKPLKRNKPAINLAKRMGFTLEAFTKGSCFIGTSPMDQAQFRMLRTEWNARKGDK